MKLRLLLVVISSLLILSSCETIKKKSDSVAKEENDKFGKFVGEHIEELKIELGSSTEDYLNEKGNKVFVYKSKKYGITCERKFEIDEKQIIIGFSSSGCI
jgi:hypothetical protein|tara:strand:- start:132 stop:434 length:303 start_codon:yes stop_codon:yes gene_type:complete